MTIGEKIKMCRKQHNLTQTEFGARLGVKKNAVSKWEVGRVEDIPASKIKAMAELFGVAPSYFIDDEQDTPGGDPGIDQTLIELLVDLTPEEEAKVLDYIRLLRNARG